MTAIQRAVEGWYQALYAMLLHLDALDPRTDAAAIAAWQWRVQVARLALGLSARKISADGVRN